MVSGSKQTRTASFQILIYSSFLIFPSHLTVPVLTHVTDTGSLNTLRILRTAAVSQDNRGPHVGNVKGIDLNLMTWCQPHTEFRDNRKLGMEVMQTARLVWFSF
jgi:hypothetical protein